MKARLENKLFAALLTGTYFIFAQLLPVLHVHVHTDAHTSKIVIELHPDEPCQFHHSDDAENEVHQCCQQLASRFSAHKHDKLKSTRMTTNAAAVAARLSYFPITHSSTLVHEPALKSLIDRHADNSRSPPFSC